MNEAHRKAQATRERNQEARTALYREQLETIRTARLALQRVLESQKATPAEILEAARLLVEIGR